MLMGGSQYKRERVVEDTDEKGEITNGEKSPRGGRKWAPKHNRWISLELDKLCLFL